MYPEIRTKHIKAELLKVKRDGGIRGGAVR